MLKLQNKIITWNHIQLRRFSKRRLDWEDVITHDAQCPSPHQCGKVLLEGSSRGPTILFHPTVHLNYRICMNQLSLMSGFLIIHYNLTLHMSVVPFHVITGDHSVLILKVKSPFRTVLKLLAQTISQGKMDLIFAKVQNQIQ